MKITYIFLTTIALGIIFSFNKYYLTANYDIRIEIPCDQFLQNCQYRSCDIDPSECLPNGFSYYQSYIVKAYDFKKCSDTTCQNECESGVIKCTPQDVK